MNFKPKAALMTSKLEGIGAFLQHRGCIEASTLLAGQR